VLVRWQARRICLISFQNIARETSAGIEVCARYVVDSSTHQLIILTFSQLVYLFSFCKSPYQRYTYTNNESLNVKTKLYNLTP